MPGKRKASRRGDISDEDWEPEKLAVRLRRGLMSPISPAGGSKMRKLVPRKNRFLNRSNEPDSDEESIICLGELSLPDDVVVSTKEKVRQSEPVAQESSGVALLFKSLPLEIHQHITEYLPVVHDVASYALVCQKTGSAVTASVWRERFVQDFDMATGKPDELARKYAFRMGHTKKWTCFDLGKYASQTTAEDFEAQKKNRAYTLDMLRDLILESNAHKVRDSEGNEIIVARNIQFIRDLVSGIPNYSYLDIIQSILNTENDWDPKTVVTANHEGSQVLLIQLCLTSISLDPKYCNHSVSHFDMSQAQVYCTPSEQPLFSGDWKSEINVRWLLHTVNFFKHHLKAEEGEGLLGYTYSELEPDQLPQHWLGHIKPGTQELGSHWKGVQTFIRPNDQSHIRSFLNTEGVPDEVEGPQFLQDLTFFFNDDNFSVGHWPKKWEEILTGDAFGGRTVFEVQRKNSGRRAGLRSAKPKESKPKLKEVPKIKHFYGTSRGSRTAHFFGRLQALPAQGQGSKAIHGFQRITMMEFYTANGEYDPTEIWGYEGCVLPGGRIIVGRWWEGSVDMNAPDVYSGPFMFWNVDRSVAVPSIQEDEALNFLADHYDLMLM